MHGMNTDRNTLVLLLNDTFGVVIAVRYDPGDGGFSFAMGATLFCYSVLRSYVTEN